MESVKTATEGMLILTGSFLDSAVEVSQLIEGGRSHVHGVGLELGEAVRLGEGMLLF